MTEHPDDNSFESDPEVRDPFDQASDASASIPEDPYDQLDATGGGIEEPEVFRPNGARLPFLRPLLKVAVVVVVVGLVVSAGVYVGPRLLALSPQPTRAIEPLKQDLDSSDAKKRESARRQILETVWRPEDAEGLKTLRRDISERKKRLGPEFTPEDGATDLILQQKLEELGVWDEPATPPNNPGAQVDPVRLDVSSASGTSPVAIPLLHSILLAAVLGQVEPDDPLAVQINKALETLQRSQTEEDRFPYHLYLADLYRKSKNVVQAIDHIERAERIARSRPEYRVQVNGLRMKILDASLKVVHDGNAETATAIGNVHERLQDLTKKDGRLDEVETAASDVATGLDELTKKDGRLDKVETAASDAGIGIQELTKKDGRLEMAETAAADVGKGLVELTKKDGRLDKVETAASDAGIGIQELTKKGGRLDRMADGLASLEDGTEKIDEALRRAIYLILETDTLTYRLGNCKPLNDRVAEELKKATALVAERDKTYLSDLPKLNGEKLREDYRQLRRIDMKLSAWETDTLIREGIQSEKDDPKGLLADLRKLDGIEKIPTDVIGREDVQSMIDKIPSAPVGGSGGVSPSTVDARIKKSETTLKAIISGVETALNGRINSVEDGLAGKIGAAEAKAIVETRATKSEETFAKNLDAAEKRLNEKVVVLANAQKELDEKIKQPKPLPPDQLANLHGHTQKLVEEELARRGILPVTLPKCEAPKGPTPATNLKKALYQFNQGCVYFHSQSKEQMPAATRCFAEATNLDPNDPSYRYLLGCSLYGEGRAVEAMEQVRCAAELEKRRNAGAEVGQRLERIQYGTRQWLERCRQSVLLGF